MTMNIKIYSAIILTGTFSFGKKPPKKNKQSRSHSRKKYLPWIIIWNSTCQYIFGLIKICKQNDQRADDFDSPL